MDRKRPMFHWGGKEYPQGDFYYEWNGVIVFRETECPPFFRKYLPKSLVKDCLCLSADAHELGAWQTSISIGPQEEVSVPLEAAIKELLSESESFAVFFLLDCDGVNSVEELTPEKALLRLADNLVARSGIKKGLVLFS